MSDHREAPIKRVNPSGREVWIARYTGPDGKRRSAGTFKLKRDAQQAINTAYETAARAPLAGPTVRAYVPTWLTRHPRAERTNHTNERRIRRMLDVDVGGVLLGDVPVAELEPLHMHRLIDYMLVTEGRARTGALNVLSSFSAMLTDAVADRDAVRNPLWGVKIRQTDPRIRKGKREIRVWSWEEMHRLAEHSACPAMIRVMSDCGLRLGEVLALERRHWRGDRLEIRQTVWRRQIMAGDKTSHGQEHGGRVVPVPPDLERLLRDMPRRIDSPFLFPDPKGRVWRENNWRRDFWEPARRAAGVDATPHELRHSWVSLLRAAGVDEADLAQIAGHTVQTMRSTYVHALGRSFEAVRGAVGA